MRVDICGQFCHLVMPGLVLSAGSQNALKGFAVSSVLEGFGLFRSYLQINALQFRFHLLDSIIATLDLRIVFLFFLWLAPSERPKRLFLQLLGDFFSLSE
jgi:hypothetical protein